jgi:anti-anti-sigma regulatory factor
VETRNVQRIILEGALVEPWVRELKETWASAVSCSPPAGLVVDLTDVTTISKEGEEVLAS